MKCLLCGSLGVTVKDTYSKEALIALWDFVDVRKDLKLDVVNLYHCSSCDLKYFDPELAGGDQFYSELGKLDWYYLHPGKTEYDYVQQYIKKGDNILDVGAGRGVLYSKIKEDVNYTGLELSTKAVQLAKEANINVVQQYLQEHSLENEGRYDLVCLFQVLEHLTELDSFLKSVFRTLKNKGLFVIAVPNNDGFVSYTPNYTFNLPPHHTILWSELSLRFLAKKYNFEVVEVEKEPLQDIHKEIAYQSYLIMLLKKALFIPNKLIDSSKGHLVVSKIIGKLLKRKAIKNLLFKLIASRNKYGQSIIITLQKINK